VTAGISSAIEASKWGRSSSSHQVLVAHEMQLPRRRRQEKPMVMGCYGIGVTRIAAAAIEQNPT